MKDETGCFHNGGGVAYLMQSVAIRFNHSGSNHIHGRNYSRFRPSCVRLVYCLHEHKEFHDMQTECQIILIDFLLLIYHKSLAIDR